MPVYNSLTMQQSNVDVNAFVRIEQRSNSFPLSEGQLISSLKNKVNFTYCTYEADLLVGFIIYQVVFDTADIIHIVIDKSFQGKSYGKSLLISSLDELLRSGVKSCFLEVRKQNTSAQRLYESVGFELIDIRKSYYKLPEDDGLVLMKSLVKS